MTGCSLLIFSIFSFLDIPAFSVHTLSDLRELYYRDHRSHRHTTAWHATREFFGLIAARYIWRSPRVQPYVWWLVAKGPLCTV
jgi:hypothetical protein